LQSKDVLCGAAKKKKKKDFTSFNRECHIAKPYVTLLCLKIDRNEVLACQAPSKTRPAQYAISKQQLLISAKRGFKRTKQATDTMVLLHRLGKVWSGHKSKTQEQSACDLIESVEQQRRVSAHQHETIHWYEGPAADQQQDGVTSLCYKPMLINVEETGAMLMAGRLLAWPDAHDEATQGLPHTAAKPGSARLVGFLLLDFRQRQVIL